MNLINIGGIIDSVGKIADNLITTDKERLDAQIEMTRLGIEEEKIQAGLLHDQIDVNKIEAASDSLFKSGWRPAVGWVCVIALGYQFLLYPLLGWAWAFMQSHGWVPTTLNPTPTVNTEDLYGLLLGMLGLGGMRSFEKVKKVAK